MSNRLLFAGNYGCRRKVVPAQRLKKLFLPITRRFPTTHSMGSTSNLLSRKNQANKNKTVLPALRVVVKKSNILFWHSFRCILTDLSCIHVFMRPKFNWHELVGTLVQSLLSYGQIAHKIYAYIKNRIPNDYYW